MLPQAILSSTPSYNDTLNDTLDHDLELVRQIAGSIARRLPRHVELAELVALGNLGLVEARRRWDRSRGVPFQAFASLRIRGAIIDGLREEDTATRQERVSIRRQEVDQPAVRRVGFEAAERQHADVEAPDEALERARDGSRVRRALTRLPERERAVVEAHFLSEEPLRSIGERLGVTESRVCQIVRAATSRLRAIVDAG